MLSLNYDKTSENCVSFSNTQKLSNRLSYVKGLEPMRSKNMTVIASAIANSVREFHTKFDF